MNVLVAGELNVDLVLQNYLSFPALGQETLCEDVILTLGSSSAICAAGMAKLGNSVSFTGKIGEDAWGDTCVKYLEKLHVDHSRVIRDRTVKTGITVSISGTRDRAMVTYLGAMETMRLEDITGPGFEGFQHFHVASLFLQRALRPDLKKLLATAHAHGLTTSADPGFDPEQKWGRDIVDLLTEVDVFLPNEVELAGLSGTRDAEQGLRALDNGRTLTVAKLGRDGCAVLEHGTLVRMPAFLVQPVDTTGAGDSFNAGFLHSWWRKAPLRESLRFAAACGAISTLASGGTTAQATEAQAREFLAGRD